MLSPYWQGVSLGDGETITSATGFPEFDDRTRADLVDFRDPTAGGEMFAHQWTDHCPARYRIAFRANHPYTVKARALADGASNWYIGVNGTVTGRTGPADFDIPIGAGLNVITIWKTASGTDRLRLLCLLFDGVNATWEAPR